ncbi:hypothetical protein LCGC14_1797570 [marine sediment metagenome]|uniref:Uncharacterized protein n=1 Tax=marine sediment metagenome TaxID=412755 RepID=A0A0F9J5D2_9ZZZZ
MYFSKFKHESECGDEFCEYDENTDMYFTPEGWYEAIYSETGLDYGYIFLGEDPTHWTLVPKPPKENNVETTPIFNPDSKVEVSDDCKITTTFAAKENKDA